MIKKFKMYESVKDKFKFNKPIFKTAKIISSQFGYKLLRYLGKGDYGYAFLLNDDKVLKITSDIREVNYVMRNLNVKKDGIITYRKIVKISNNLIKNDSYGILLDYAEPLSKEDKKIYMEFYIHFYYFYEIMEDIYIENMEDEIEDLIINWKNKYINDFNQEDIFKDKERVRYLISKLIKLGKNLKKNKIDWEEAHVNNIGWDKNGDLVFFDVV